MMTFFLKNRYKYLQRCSLKAVKVLETAKRSKKHETIVEGPYMSTYTYILIFIHISTIIFMYMYMFVCVSLSLFLRAVAVAGGCG